MVHDNGDLTQLQHILVVGGVKRQTRAKTDLRTPRVHDLYPGSQLDFEENQPMDVAGRWSQSVFQVDDSPRYSAIGTWIHADGKHYWEAESQTPYDENTQAIRPDAMDRLNRGNSRQGGPMSRTIKNRLDGDKKF